jgi:putative peptidoglycan lipid II flippase
VTAKRSITRTTLLLLPVHVVLRAAEPLLPLFLAYWFGSNDATDIYYFAWAVFAFAGSLAVSAYQDSALVPVIAEERLARTKELPRFVGSVLAHTWVVGGAIAAVVGVVALSWFSVRYEGESFALAAKMVVPFSLFLLAMCTRTFFGAVLTAERHFFVQPVGAGIGMVANLTVLATFHDLPGVGIAIVPVGALAGEVVGGAILAWFALRVVGLRIVLCFDRPPALITMAKLVASEVAGGAVTRLNPVVDQLMAGLAAVAGGGTLLRLSGDVSTVPTSLLQAALLPVLLTHLSDDFASGDRAAFKHKVRRSLVVVCIILAAAALLLYFVREPLLRLVFLRGAMDEAGVARMARIFPYHLVGLPAFGALLVLARSHVAMKNGRIMVSMGILNASSNVVLNLLLFRFIGLEGLALATSCVSCVVALVFWIRLRRRLADA